LKAKVAVVKCENYELSNVVQAVGEALDLLGGINKFVNPGQKVLLKPNLLSARPPETAIVTHPTVVEAVATLASQVGGICSIGDSPATIVTATPDSYLRLLEITGMRKVIERTGMKVARFDDGGSERELPSAPIFRKILLANAISDHDVIINLPKFKTHSLTTITCGVKNLYGCIPGTKKMEFHLQTAGNPELFAQILVNILAIVKPRLTIADAIVGMDEQGPNAGRRRNFGFILASTDPVALDAVACKIAGIDPMTIPSTRLATEQGVGTGDLTEIEIVGAPLEEVYIFDFRLPPNADILNRTPKFINQILRNHLVSRPAILQGKCTLCKTCLKTCPVKAIRSNDKKLLFDYSLCIRCYCCQEICPQEAIVLRTSNLRWILAGGIFVLWKLKQCIKKALQVLRAKADSQTVRQK
jgi:uncharacterized protein (DUF362 family)/Pyruvate/2-oxoacid:ferredoxin oxidoreductase delta subunit